MVTKLHPVNLSSTPADTLMCHWRMSHWWMSHCCMSHWRMSHWRMSHWSMSHWWSRKGVRPKCSHAPIESTTFIIFHNKNKSTIFIIFHRRWQKSTTIELTDITLTVSVNRFICWWMSPIKVHQNTTNLLTLLTFGSPSVPASSLGESLWQRPTGQQSKKIGCFDEF